ncbi:hypothetical protein [Asticcacaulis sp.]|uniref:hypothetical protein n=1 Tax=Asticcacaulis sp. TaxID=1872648 RepID=UPI00261FB4AF|nr:hypothetical protein [Asticcacaulis sp.]
MFRADPGRVGVWGGSQSGKTRYAKALARSFPRRIVLDYLDAWGDLCPQRAGTINQLLDHIKAGWAGQIAARYVPPRGVNPVEALAILSDLLFKVQQPYKDGRDNRHLWLIVEEMADPAPLTLRAATPFGQLCRYGRHHGIGIVGISQRMAEVTPTFRGNCETHVFFRMDGARDLQAAGDRVKPIDPAYVRELSLLQNNHGLKVSAGKVERVKNS